MSETIVSCVVTFVLAVVGTMLVASGAIDKRDKDNISAGYMVVDGKAYKITPVSP